MKRGNGLLGFGKRHSDSIASFGAADVDDFFACLSGSSSSVEGRSDRQLINLYLLKNVIFVPNAVSNCSCKLYPGIRDAPLLIVPMKTPS